MADPVVIDPVPAKADPEPEPKPAAVPEPDWGKPIPEDHFPESMRESMKGKTVKDLAGDHAKSRQQLSRIGEEKKALETRISELEGKTTDAPDLTDDQKAEIAADYQAQQMVSQKDFREVLDEYFQTDEVSEDFLATIEKEGYRPTRSEALEFLHYIKQKRQTKIENIDAATEGAVEGEELWEWMMSEECPMSHDLLVGFNSQADEGEYAWVPLAVKKYQEWQEGGGKTSKGGKGRFKGPTRRGRAPQARAGEGDISKEDFTTQLLEVRRKRDQGQLSKADAMRAEKELIARREQTLSKK